MCDWGADSKSGRVRLWPKAGPNFRTAAVTPGPTNVVQTAVSGTAAIGTAATTVPTATAAPTATPVPLAATVNGQDIPLAAYERELARCQAGRHRGGC